jgi:hypothetical protein
MPPPAAQSARALLSALRNTFFYPKSVTIRALRSWGALTFCEECYWTTKAVVLLTAVCVLAVFLEPELSAA